MRFARSLPLLLLALCLLVLTGCVTEERLAQLESIATRAEAIAEKAQAGLATAEKAVAMADQALVTARRLAEVTQSEQAQRAVDVAGKALAEAEQALPVARAAVETTRQTAALAKATYEEATAQKAAGAGGWELALSIGLSLLAGGGTAAAPLLGAIRRYRTATALAAAHADRMEKADTLEDIEAAKQRAMVEQSAAGVHTLIAAVRGK